MARESAKPVQWVGPVPKTCDLCGIFLAAAGPTFVDGATIYGPWVIMCKPCHETSGHGLGTGLGQEFNIKSGIKVGG